MARYTGAVCRLCRREGQKLFLKGDRCFTGKCSVSRRSYAPGQHGQGRSKPSEYGSQLRAKQLTKRVYGVLEKPFRTSYERAKKREGKVGEQLLVVLESRLDNIVYRLGFAESRPQARQLVEHRFFLVNGKRVNIPSFLVKPDSVVSVADKKQQTSIMKKILEAKSSKVVPAWLECNKNKFEGKMLSYPERSDIDLDVEETLIVELYSKV
jgi:small subunit ribosomal protein S4